MRVGSSNAERVYHQGGRTPISRTPRREIGSATAVMANGSGHARERALQDPGLKDYVRPSPFAWEYAQLRCCSRRYPLYPGRLLGRVYTKNINFYFCYYRDSVIALARAPLALSIRLSIGVLARLWLSSRSSWPMFPKASCA